MNFIDDEKHSKLLPIRVNKSSKRILTKQSSDNVRNLLKGKVVAALGKTYFVKPDLSEDGKLIECAVSGKLITPHFNCSLVAVGDIVYFSLDDSHKNTNIILGSISEIELRRNYFSRKANGEVETEHVFAANIDYLIILASLKQPDYNLRLIDRMLAAAELNVIKPIIIINKCDLALSSNELEKIINNDFKIYESLNIPIFYVSFLRQISDIRLIAAGLSGKSSLVVGPSGVGKSTLINYLLKDNPQSVSEISTRTLKGRHTTSAVKMFKLEDSKYDNEHCKLWNDKYGRYGYEIQAGNKGNIIDSPGIREFGLWGMNKEDLGFYFHEFDEYHPHCRYQPCTHTHEPECSVVEAVEKGEISINRYESYLNIFDSLV